MIMGSKIMYMAGMRRSTEAMLMSAPLESRVQMEAIISTREYHETPKVATKKLKPLVRIERMLALWAIVTDSCFVFPAFLSVMYLLVMRIA